MFNDSDLFVKHLLQPVIKDLRYGMISCFIKSNWEWDMNCSPPGNNESGFSLFRCSLHLARTKTKEDVTSCLCQVGVDLSQTFSNLTAT